MPPPRSSLLALAAALLAAGARAQAPASYDPIAAPAATVVQGRWRLTVLTPNLVRAEAALNASAPAWDDRATTSIVNRRLPVPAFTRTPLNASAVTVTTAALTIAACCGACGSDASCVAWVYATSAAGAAASRRVTDVPGVNCWPLAAAGGAQHGVTGRVLGGSADSGSLPPNMFISITFKTPPGAGGGAGPTTTWTHAVGATDAQNLNGTYQALDCYSTPMQCNDQYRASMQPGLLSRSGWVLLDDSTTARLAAAPDAPAGIPTWWDSGGRGRLAPTGFDVYFGARSDADFKAMLADWVAVLGRPAMLPRSAFGVWWSRYYPYTETSIVEEVLSGYKNYSIPLNMLVFDMDWHNEPTDPSCQSWGNYDVNTQLFPDGFGPFAERLHAHGDVLGNPLRISFNVHPQTGVDHCDSRYATIAVAMGIDPSTNQTVQCDFGNKTFTDSLFSTYYDAAPLHLVDSWWTDYGGCGGPGGGTSSQLWSNRVYYEHQKYGRQVRGQAFSRYGGTGNHLAPHGFSGDTFMHEVALHWEVATTQTAANVLWGYWSHDIGGFHNGPGAPGDDDPTNSTGSELFLRWEMRDAMRLRNALGPYIYTEARVFYDTGVATVHPLYYDFPLDARLYEHDTVEAQYAFGSAILAAPITQMAAVPNGTLHTPMVWPVYLPASAAGWRSWNGTAFYAAGAAQTITQPYGTNDMPLFVAADALLPLKTMASVAGNFPDPIIWAVFAGGAPTAGAPAGGNYTLYEDDGDSDAYIGGEFVTTTAAWAWAGAKSLSLTVAGASTAGALPDGFPQARAHWLQLRGVAAAGAAVQAVTANGASVPPGAPGAGPAFYVVTEADHSLAAPAGSLVVETGAASSWDDLIVTVTFA